MRFIREVSKSFTSFIVSCAHGGWLRRPFEGNGAVEHLEPTFIASSIHTVLEARWLNGESGIRLNLEPRQAAPLRFDKSQHEPIAAIAQLGNAEIPRIVGAAEHRAFLIKLETDAGNFFDDEILFYAVK
jgi:hypothetical protein